MVANESAQPHPTAAESGIPWHSTTVLAVLGTVLMVPMDIPLISPGLPKIQAAFDISGSQAGLLFTVYALPAVFLAPLIGAIADRIGRKRILTICLALFGIGGLAIGFVSDFTTALIFRGIQGLAAGPILVSLATTIVGDSFSNGRHDAIMGATSAALSVGAATYPTLGGFLFSITWNAPFLLYGLAILMALFVLVSFDEPDLAEKSESGNIHELLETVPIRLGVVLFGIILLINVLTFGFFTILPYILTDRFGLDSLQIGLLTTALLLVTAGVSFQNGRLVQSASMKILISGGIGLYATAFFVLALAPGFGVLLGGLVIIGIAGGVVKPALFTAISTLATDKYRARVMSVLAVTTGAGMTVGPVLFTGLGINFGYDTTLIGASGVAVAGAAGATMIQLKIR